MDDRGNLSGVGVPPFFFSYIEDIPALQIPIFVIGV